ncbi:MAG: hypothetical protein J0M11_17225 [Anaerolineae bacterium]|nr:hypothetical protein [Anaerolineae bacterium]
MYSIFHFWLSLFENKAKFKKISKLEKFPFHSKMFSCVNKGVFPDLAIKINTKGPFSGGELIELKDSKSYTVSSFNSTIPAGRKNIRSIVGSGKSSVFKQMQKAGDEVYSLEERDVYYLVRGRKKKFQKICLVHGSFFETIPAKDLVGEAFLQMLEEQLEGKDVTNEIKKTLKGNFSDQETFSSVRNIQNASVKVRFRVMTEANQEGNILNPEKYPDILDDTLNLICPYHSEDEKEELISNVASVLGMEALSKFNIFPIKHPLNGLFLVFQTAL